MRPATVPISRWALAGANACSSPITKPTALAAGWAANRSNTRTRVLTHAARRLLTDGASRGLSQSTHAANVAARDTGSASGTRDSQQAYTLADSAMAARRVANWDRMSAMAVLCIDWFLAISVTCSSKLTSLPSCINTCLLTSRTLA